MTVFFIILGALIAVGLPLYIAHRIDRSNRHDSVEADNEQQPQPVIPEECCGQHEVCERDSLLSAVSKDIEYYDDEELDLYRGRASGDYTPEEEEQFREILLTLLPEDVAGWGRSLQLRGIELPTPCATN